MEKNNAPAIGREDFRRLVIETGEPCLVCFMGRWSEPSRRMEEAVAQAARRWNGRVSVYVIDPDMEPFITNDYGVEAVPAFIFFKNGRDVDRMVGVRTAGQLEKFIEQTYNE